MGLALAGFTPPFGGAGVFSDGGGSFLGGPRLEDRGRDALRSEPLLGDFKASFHSWTLLTASSYSVGLVGTTETVLFALNIHGCFNNRFADILRLGFF